MPQLEELPLAATSPSEEPGLATKYLGLTASGTLTYRIGAAPKGEPLYATIDTTGKVLARFGKNGEGPGDVNGVFLMSGDSTIVIASPFLQQFQPDGSVVSERKGKGFDGLPQDPVGDSVDFIEARYPRSGRDSGAYHPGPIVRRCLAAACERVLLYASDSFLREAVVSIPRSENRWPPFAAAGDRFVIGDGVGYRLWMFGLDGKVQYSFGRQIPSRFAHEREVALRGAESQSLPPAVAKADVGREAKFSGPLAHFTYRGLAFDGSGRLWVMGRVADSMFFDVFADSTFLGRVTINCFAYPLPVAAVRGHWVAVNCYNGPDAEVANSLRLFRIVEPKEVKEPGPT